MGTRRDAGEDCSCRAVPVLAAIVLIAIAMAGVPAAAQDDRIAAPTPRAAAPAETDLHAPRSTAAPRVYVPLQPADPAQVDKQFAIGQDTAFGVQSEELIRSGRHEHDRDPSKREGGVPPKASAVSPVAPAGGPEAAAK